MKSKLDTAGASFICTRLPEQRIAFDTGQPKVDRETGLPLWQVQLMALDATGADVRCGSTVPVRFHPAAFPMRERRRCR